MADLLQVDGLAVAYGKLRVLHGVSFAVKPGQFTILLGRNGAGKTTTLRAIAGLIGKQEGRVHFGGQDITSWSPRRILRQGLAQVLDGHRVFPSLSVHDNLVVSALGCGRPRVKSTFEPIYDAFPELDERRNQLASRLSGGQQQILAVAQGLVAHPRLLVLDEPSAGLAPMVVDRIMQIAKSLTTEGTAVLLVEQFVEKAMRHADYCYALDHGVLVAAGTPDALQQSNTIHDIYLGAEMVPGPS